MCRPLCALTNESGTLLPCCRRDSRVPPHWPRVRPAPPQRAAPYFHEAPVKRVRRIVLLTVSRSLASIPPRGRNALRETNTPVGVSYPHIWPRIRGARWPIPNRGVYPVRFGGRCPDKQHTRNTTSDEQTHRIRASDKKRNSCTLQSTPDLHLNCCCLPFSDPNSPPHPFSCCHAFEPPVTLRVTT